MTEKVTTSNIENDDFTLNTEESEYKNLIARLKEISAVIDLLGKKISR